MARQRSGPASKSPASSVPTPLTGAHGPRRGGGRPSSAPTSAIVDMRSPARPPGRRSAAAAKAPSSAQHTNSARSSPLGVAAATTQAKRPRPRIPPLPLPPAPSTRAAARHRRTGTGGATTRRTTIAGPATTRMPILRAHATTSGSTALTLRPPVGLNVGYLCARDAHETLLGLGLRGTIQRKGCWENHHRRCSRGETALSPCFLQLANCPPQERGRQRQATPVTRTPPESAQHAARTNTQMRDGPLDDA